MRNYWRFILNFAGIFLSTGKAILIATFIHNFIFIEVTKEQRGTTYVIGSAFKIINHGWKT